MVGKKRKRNTSSDNSDVEVMPAQSPREDEESSIQVKESLKKLHEKILFTSDRQNRSR